MIRLHGAVLAMVFLAGCGLVPAMPPPEELATPQNGYGRAFGRIVYVEGGKEVDLIAGALPLFVRSPHDPELLTVFTERGGEFAWPLRPGDYVLVAYQRLTSKMLNPMVSETTAQTVRIWARFNVPAAGQAVYIGDLRLEPRSFSVSSRFDEALVARTLSFQKAGFQTSNALAQPEQVVESYKRVAPICNQAVWGIACTDEYRGLEPVLPEGTASGYPAVESLSPVLEWKPAGKPNVTYDVVIFESYPRALSRPQLRGARVSYAEGLKEPRFIVSPALLAGKAYEWSVRARQGDMVSSWSTISFDWVIKSGRGASFGFTTPAK